MKITKKLISVILSVMLIFATFTVAFTVNAEQKDYTPVVFVPGIGQSQTYKYDDEGNVVADYNLFHINTDFANYSVFDWVTFVKFVAEFIVSICVQKDVVSPGTINGIFKILMADHLRDENGDFINNIETPNYPYSVKDYDEEAKDIFDSRIPCQELLDTIGEENVYCYNYSVFSTTEKTARGLNDYIKNVVLPQTGADQVILVPMSMGATVVNCYMNLFPESKYVEKIVSVVGAWDGSDVFANLMLAEFDQNAPDLVYTGAINDLAGFLGDEYVGYIVNIAARILPKQEVDYLLYDIIDAVVDTIAIPNTSFISLIPHNRYNEFAEKYLSDESLAETREQTDRYALAQANLEQRLYDFENKNGTEFYFISGYNLQFGDMDFGFFKYFDSYDETNSDGVIQISSTAPGTSFVPAGTKFDDDYINNKSHHVSPDGSIDTSTCYYEDTTWYFDGQKHELTDNNTALKVAFDIAVNKVKSVNDCTEKYPQFNQSRDLRRLTRNYLPDAKSIDTSKLETADSARLNKAIKDCESMIDCTFNNREEDDKLIAGLLSLLKELNAKYNLFEHSYLPDSEPSTGMKILTEGLGLTSEILLQIFGKKGFADFNIFG